MRDDLHLEVVWDGAHNGCDGDLLHRDVALPEKRPGATLPVAARKEVFANQRAAVLRVLETTTAWLTLVELATCVGCTTHIANQVIYLPAPTPAVGPPSAEGQCWVLRERV